MPLLHASLLSLLLAAPAPSPRVSPKPVSPPASRFSAPEVRVQGYRVVVEKLTQARNFSTDFAGNGQPSGGKTTRRQMVVVSLAVHPSNVSLLPHIAGLGTRAVAYSPSDAALPFRAYPVEDPGPLRSGTWRTQVVAEELDVGITQINRLQGELIVYPKARRVTLEFPLPSNTPQTRTVDGFRAVLRSFKPRPGGFSAVVSTDWPASISVAQPNAEGAGGITAVTHEGAVILPNSAGSTEAQSRARLGRQYTLAFTDVKEMPVRVRLEVLVRSGAPTRVAFRLPDLPLPQGLDLSAELEEPAGGTGPLRPGDSLYTANGATLVVPVRHDGAAANGTVLVGLSRVDGAGAGSWRWIEVAADAEGRAVLGSLRPGRYRVARQWLGEPRQSEEPGRLPEHPVRAQAVLEAELLPGKTAILPVLQLGATP